MRSFVQFIVFVLLMTSMRSALVAAPLPHYPSVLWKYSLPTSTLIQSVENADVMPLAGVSEQHLRSTDIPVCAINADRRNTENFEYADNDCHLKTIRCAYSWHRQECEDSLVMLSSFPNKQESALADNAAPIQDSIITEQRNQPVLMYQPSSQAPSERPYRYTFDGAPVRKTTQIDVGKALLYGGVYGLGVGAAQYYQYQAFWSDRLSFRTIEDGDLELGADKAGHMFAGYFMSKFSTDVLLSAGFGEDIATIGGGLMGLGYQFFVEIQDGYGNGWGFSPSDMIANTLGAGLHIAQRYVPGLQYVKMKAEFYPAPWFGEKTRKGSTNPIDDYSAWTWWLSLDVHGILPEVAKPYWPSWLNLAFGYASRNLEWQGEQSRRYIISLDYDLEKLLPDGAPFWNWLKQYLNILKLPAPALEFGVLDDGKGNVRPMPVRAYLVFPFKIPF